MLRWRKKTKAEQADVIPPRGYVMGVKIKNSYGYKVY